MDWLRERFGSIIVGGVVGLLALVFGMDGFYPKSIQSMQSRGIAGSVDGEPISIGDFDKALQRREEFFRNMTGGKLTDAQMRSFHLKEAVFNDLVSHKLMEIAAKSQGLTASDEEVRDKIREMDVFKKDGQFDYLTYKNLLQANGYSEARFEEMMRDDLSAEAWQGYFQNRVRVSDEEVRRQFLVSHERRNIKYVLITPEEVIQGLYTTAQLDQFAADAKNKEAVKSRYEAGKTSLYKGLAEDEAKRKIAGELILEQKTDEIRKDSRKLADEVAAEMTPAKTSDAKINGVLKKYKVVVQYTGMINPLTRYLPGMGEAPDLLDDAFSPHSPIDPASGGRAKVYNSAAWFAVAVVTQSEKPDLAQLPAERDKLIQQISMRKERDLYEAWLKQQFMKAKIEKNAAIVDDTASS